MVNATYAQSSFLGGEWSKTSQGRFDKPEYRTAMNYCLNGFPVEQGPWTRRPGTRYGNHTRNGLAARPITFSFQNSSPYTMEFTDTALRFHAGELLATTNDNQTVSAISSANPAVVQTSGSHGWATGNQVMFPMLGTIDPLLLNRQFVITVVDGTHFSLVDPLTNATIDGALLATFTTGTVARIAELTAPYTAAMLPTVRSVQAEKRAVLLHGSVAPQQLVAIPPTGNNSATFTLSPAQFFDGPYLDPVIGGTITPASVSGLVGCTIQSPTWSSSAVYNPGDYVVYSSITYKSLIPQNINLQPDTHSFAWAVVTQDSILNPNGLQASDLGRHIRLFSEPLAWASGTTYSAGQSVKYNNTYYSSVIASNLNNIPGLDLAKWVLNPNAALWSWGTITSLTGAIASLVSPIAGTPFGDLINLTAAFDGVLVRNSGAGSGCCMLYGLGGGATDFAVGTYISAGQAVSYVKVFAPQNWGFVSWNGAAGQLTINLRGKATAPSSDSDGTLLGSSSNTSVIPGSTIQIFSNDATTAYKYIWIEYVVTGGLVVNVSCAQLQLYTASAFSGTGITVQILGPALLYTTAITTWRLGLFTSATGYPTCGTYHEGRLWLSGLIGNRVDASALVDIYGNATPNLFYFTPTSQAGTVSAGNAISSILTGPDVNAVVWMEPHQQGINIGTQAGEWLAQATTINQPLSPLNMQVHRVTSIGCANTIPCRTEHTLVFIQKHQLKLMEYFSDVFSGKFTAPNLAEHAQHLTAGVLQEVAYQQEMMPVLWARGADGQLLGATYKRDSLMSSQGPTFVGWHQHTLGSGRTVTGLCVGPSPSSEASSAGMLDTLSLVTYDAGTNIYHMEFMTKLFQETNDIKKAWFLDDAIIPAVQQNIVFNGNSTTLLSGLWHLNGKTVTAVIDGLDCGDYQVSNGIIHVPYGAANGLYTSTFAAAATTWLVGFTYTSRGQVVRPATAQESGTRQGPALGKTRRSNVVSMQLVNTQGLSVGTSFTDAVGGSTSLTEARLMSAGGTIPLTPQQLFTGVLWQPLTDQYSLDSMLCWQVTRPYPATVVAIGASVSTQDQ